MKITRFEIYKFELPLQIPLHIKDHTLLKRTGYIIRFDDEANHTGLGELSPLPDLHDETLIRVFEELQQIRAEIIHKNFPTLQEEIWDVCNSFFSIQSTAPTVRFGVECALLNLIASNSQRSLAGVLFKKYKERVYINALITRGEKDISTTIRQIITEGYRSIKLKVGRNEVDRDIETVREVSRLITGKAQLRLDANRAWTLEEAVEFARGTEDCAIEYIEEPLKEVKRLPDLYEQTDMPIALDESVVESNPDSWYPSEWIKAIILKPSVIGSLQKTVKYIRLAEKHNKQVIISDTFHSGVGLAAHINIAAGIHYTDTAMGFDTYRWLAQDVLNERFNIEQASFSLKEINQKCKQINYSIVEQIN